MQLLKLCYTAAIAATLTLPMACSKKTAQPLLAQPTLAQPVLLETSVETMQAADRLKQSYINTDGQRVDASGMYYLDEKGNIIGKVNREQAYVNKGPAATVYFDYDSSQLSEDSQVTLNKQAIKLTTQPSLAVVIEGHTDQRGTREYNLALGERRAKQVKDYLEFTGVKSSQITSTSYGKEKLATTDESEEGLKQNRRAELHFPNP